MSDAFHDDVALVEACVAGDLDARRALVLRHLRPVRQALGFLPQARDGRVSADDVEDAVQLAFMAFFARDAAVLVAWRRESLLRTYLNKVALRIARKHLRTVTTRGGRFRLDLDSGDDAWGDPADDGPTAEARLLDETERARLREAILAKLSEKGRDFYRLLFVEEADAPEVAIQMGTNTNNVYQWKARIVRAAHEVLQEERVGREK